MTKVSRHYDVEVSFWTIQNAAQQIEID